MLGAGAAPMDGTLSATGAEYPGCRRLSGGWKPREAQRSMKTPRRPPPDRLVAAIAWIAKRRGGPERAPEGHLGSSRLL